MFLFAIVSPTSIHLHIEKHCRRIANTETYKLTGLYPDTLYYVWLAARSQRGEGATTPPIPVRTKQYGKLSHYILLDYFRKTSKEERNELVIFDSRAEFL